MYENRKETVNKVCISFCDISVMSLQQYTWKYRSSSTRNEGHAMYHHITITYVLPVFIRLKN